HRQALPATPAAVQLEPWRRTHLDTAGTIMQVAYEGTVDVEINGLYRNVEDCCSVLDSLINQGGGGTLVNDASALAYHRGQAIGFVVVTEIAPGQGHLAQVAVLPAYQRQGIGRLLVRYSLARLATLHFATLSLIVSRANTHALRLYQALDLRPVL